MFFAAINLLYLIFPENIALIIDNLHHPSGPAVADIQKALHGASHEQLTAIAARTRLLGAYVKATEEALKGISAKAGG